MGAKEYLQQVRKLNILIDRKIEQRDSLRADTVRITAHSEGERVKSSGNLMRLSDTIAKIIDLENEINADIDKLVNLKKEIIAVIDSIDNSDMIDLLYRRYLKYEKWEKIAVEMNFNIRWIYRLHGQALKKISEKMEIGR